MTIHPLSHTSCEGICNPNGSNIRILTKKQLITKLSFYDKYTESYEDIIAYNEELIEDAFEGDPDAYWNID